MESQLSSRSLLKKQRSLASSITPRKELQSKSRYKESNSALENSASMNQQFKSGQLGELKLLHSSKNQKGDRSATLDQEASQKDAKEKKIYFLGLANNYHKSLVSKIKESKEEEEAFDRVRTIEMKQKMAEARAREKEKLKLQIESSRKYQKVLKELEMTKEGWRQIIVMENTKKKHLKLLQWADDEEDMPHANLADEPVSDLIASPQRAPAKQKKSLTKYTDLQKDDLTSKKKNEDDFSVLQRQESVFDDSFNINKYLAGGEMKAKKNPYSKDQSIVQQARSELKIMQGGSPLVTGKDSAPSKSILVGGAGENSAGRIPVKQRIINAIHAAPHASSSPIKFKKNPSQNPIQTQSSLVSSLKLKPRMTIGQPQKIAEVYERILEEKDQLPSMPNNNQKKTIVSYHQQLHQEALPELDDVLNKEVMKQRQSKLDEYMDKIFSIHSDVTKFTKIHYDNGNAPQVLEEIKNKKKERDTLRNYCNELNCTFHELQGAEIGIQREMTRQTELNEDLAFMELQMEQSQQIEEKLILEEHDLIKQYEAMRASLAALENMNSQLSAQDNMASMFSQDSLHGQSKLDQQRTSLNLIGESSVQLLDGAASGINLQSVNSQIILRDDDTTTSEAIKIMEKVNSVTSDDDQTHRSPQQPGRKQIISSVATPRVEETENQEEYVLSREIQQTYFNADDRQRGDTSRSAMTERGQRLTTQTTEKTKVLDEAAVAIELMEQERSTGNQTSTREQARVHSDMKENSEPKVFSQEKQATPRHTTEIDSIMEHSTEEKDRQNPPMEEDPLLTEEVGMTFHRPGATAAFRSSSSMMEPTSDSVFTYDDFEYKKINKGFLECLNALKKRNAHGKKDLQKTKKINEQVLFTPLFFRKELQGKRFATAPKARSVLAKDPCISIHNELEEQEEGLGMISVSAVQEIWERAIMTQKIRKANQIKKQHLRFLASPTQNKMKIGEVKLTAIRKASLGKNYKLSSLKPNFGNHFRSQSTQQLEQLHIGSETEPTQEQQMQRSVGIGTASVATLQPSAAYGDVFKGRGSTSHSSQMLPPPNRYKIPHKQNTFIDTSSSQIFKQNSKVVLKSLKEIRSIQVGHRPLFKQGTVPTSTMKSKGQKAFQMTSSSAMSRQTPLKTTGQKTEQVSLKKFPQFNNLDFQGIKSPLQNDAPSSTERESQLRNEYTDRTNEQTTQSHTREPAKGGPTFKIKPQLGSGTKPKRNASVVALSETGPSIAQTAQSLGPKVQAKDIKVEHFQGSDKRALIDEFLKSEPVKMYFFKILFPMAFKHMVIRSQAKKKLKQSPFLGQEGLPNARVLMKSKLYPEVVEEK